MWRTEDGSVPVRHEQIITFGKTVGTGLCVVVSDINQIYCELGHTGSESLLAFLELLQKSEVTWDFSSHFDAVGVFESRWGVVW